MNPMTFAYVVMLIAGLGGSALFSGMEIGLYTLNRVRVTILAGRGRPSALRLRRLLQHSNRTLSTLLVCNNTANYMGSFALAAILNETGLSPTQAILLNAGVLIPILFIFGETLPKDLFRTHCDHWSYRTSGFLLLCDRILTYTGIILLVHGFTRLTARLFGVEGELRTTARQRISQLIKEGAGAGLLTDMQITLVDRALALRDRTVRMEMMPWNRAVFIAAECEPQTRTSLIKHIDYTRLPVVESDGLVKGVLSSLEASLYPDRSTRDLTGPITMFTPEIKVHEALRTLRRIRQTMAVVIDSQSNRPLGLVTIKDLVEPLTGELMAW